MALNAGDKLGPYEILAPLGAGGMGEVFKARDTRLDRTVAIKVLPDHIAQRDDIRARFEREARSVASLNHPNICVLHDIGEGYMVMELIEGETLAQRIDKGPIPLDQALRFATQIADALDRAHRAGVTHRDVKPQNIMLTRDGVKVLDFGLAKSGVKPGPTEETLTKVLTTEGTVMGTPQYMAPEQFEGKEADARSDIWAFGAVLYEMVTGQKAFQGKSYSSLLGAILSADPAPMSVKSFTPSWLERLVKRCLEKDPERRYQSMRDILLDIESPPPAELVAAPENARQWPWIAAAVLALVAAGTSWIAFRATRPAELKPLVHLDVDLGTDVVLGTSSGSRAILSPDGTRLVYTSNGTLFTRKLDQTKAVELAGTKGASFPFFSPDGQWVAFHAAGSIKKISVDGGPVVSLYELRFPQGGSWGDDGNIVITTSLSILRFPAAGGASTPLLQVADGGKTTQLSSQEILPGGKAVLFNSTSSGELSLEALSLANHSRKVLLRGGGAARYLPVADGTGHLLYLRSGTLFAVPFDLDKLELRGTPLPILEHVSHFDISKNGTLVYRSSGESEAGLLTVQWLDAAGKKQPLLAKPGPYRAPRVSPDGQRLAWSDGSDIWVYEIHRDIMTRLTFEGSNRGRNDRPIWSPDGKFIVFSSRDGVSWVRSDGASKPQQLLQSHMPFSFTADGKHLAGVTAPMPGPTSIWTASIERDAAGLRAAKPEKYLDAIQPAFSPDGRWLAYRTNASGSAEIHVRAFPDKGGSWQISTAGGAYPIWSKNGRELFFRSEDNRIMVAGYSVKGDTFVPEQPRLWSSSQLADLGRGQTGGYNFDLAPDGQRLAALMPVDTPEAQMYKNHVIFLLNFSDELQRRMAAGK